MIPDQEPNFQGHVSIECPTPTKINYYHNPVLGRHSVAQLLQRRGLLGFSNLVWVSGDWRGLASPFCRLGREIPHRVICEPELICQEAENASICAAFLGRDSLGIEIHTKIPLGLFSGAPGKIHHNGGTAHQQWMAFDAFRGGATLEQIGENTILSSNGAYCAVFVGRGLRLAEDGNGWQADLAAGRHFVAAGVAFRDARLAEQRAKNALAMLERDGGMEPVRDRLRREWDELFAKFPFPSDLSEEDEQLARNAVWCIYSNLAAPEGHLKRPAVIGAKIQYPGVFPWDSAFAAVALREADPELAKHQIELYTDQISTSSDGQVGEMTALHSGGGVQFPLFSWAAWMIHQANPDRRFLARTYPQLARHAEWWLHGKSSVDGIPAYERVVCLDDSPRFDTFAGEGRMSLQEPVLGADLIAICAWDQLHLEKIAAELGDVKGVRHHREVVEKLVAFIESRLYVEDLGRYVDIGAKSGRVSSVNTPFNHFPAMFSRSEKRRSSAATALSSKGPFWGNFGLATVSPEEPSFDPCRIWRGPIWLSANMVFTLACAHMGRLDIAEEIASSSIRLVRANAPLPNGIMEYYNYQTGEGSGAHHIATMSAAPLLSCLLGHHRQPTAPPRQNQHPSGQVAKVVCA